MLLSIAGEAVLSACERACSLIDMNAHEGTHPCMGAVDLVPIYPLGEEVGLEDCGKEAQGMWSCMHRRKVKMHYQNINFAKYRNRFIIANSFIIAKNANAAQTALRVILGSACQLGTIIIIQI